MTQINKNLFGKSIALKILVCLRENSVENYCFKISKYLNCNNGHVSKYITRLTELGLIKKIKKGSSNVLELTNIGKEIADMIIDISNKIEDNLTKF